MAQVPLPLPLPAMCSVGTPSYTPTTTVHLCYLLHSCHQLDTDLSRPCHSYQASANTHSPFTALTPNIYAPIFTPQHLRPSIYTPAFTPQPLRPNIYTLPLQEPNMKAEARNINASVSHFLAPAPPACSDYPSSNTNIGQVIRKKNNPVNVSSYSRLVTRLKTYSL